MSNYVISYHGGNTLESPEEGAKQMAKWRAWVDGLGDAVVNPGTPLGKPKTVSSAWCIRRCWVGSLDRVFYRDSRQHGCCSRNG